MTKFKDWPFLHDPNLAQIWDAVEAQQTGVLRVVGGIVRDTLLGRRLGDCDLAVALPPDQVQALLQAKGIKAVPTGLEHGTVTAVCGGRGFEITSLRCDVATDGRHAQVAFTDDWAQDAARRDFTINALYVDRAGKLYDFVGGQADLAARRLRFIGVALARLTEDYLRLLRYFRFAAELGWPADDPEALAACAAARTHLSSLSVERIWHEVKRLLGADAPLGVLTKMEQTGVLGTLLPENTGVETFARLLSFAVSAPAETDALPLVLLRLLSLLPPDKEAIAALAKRWHLSTREKKTALALLEVAHRFDRALAPRATLYAARAHPVGGLLLAAAQGKVETLAPYWAALQKGPLPVFPLKGKDLLALGMPQGAQIAVFLARLENWWIENDFRPDPAACREKAKAWLDASA